MADLHGDPPVDHSGMNGVIQGVGDPLVQALALGGGSGGELGVEFAGDADVELAGIGFAGLHALLPAHLQEYAQGSDALFVEAVDVPRVEVGAAVEADELSAKHFDFGVVLNDRPIAFDLH